MKRPDSVKIGLYEWSIRYLTADEWEEDEQLSKGNAGETHAAQQTIKIVLEHPSGDLNEAYLRMILLHEILHACMEISNITYTMTKMKKNDIEEAVVGALSPTLLAVLRENPKVHDYLMAL